MLPGCEGEVGSLQHILLHCPALAEARSRMLSLWSSFLVSNPLLFPVVKYYTLGGDSANLQFLLDPSVLPMVISLSSTNPDTLKHCFYLTRTWNYSMHLTREKLVKLWNIK